jgi:hypothetical protein
MLQTAIHNGIAIVAALGFAGILGIPVYEDYQKVLATAQAQGPIINPLSTLGTYGLGPLSGLMLFVMAAPIIITGAPTLLTKLLGVTIGFLTSAALSAVAVLAERGETLAATLLGGLAILVLATVFGQQGRMARSRALATQRLVAGSIKAIDGVTRSLRGGPLGAGSTDGGGETAPNRSELTDPTSAFHMAALVDQLVKGVIWQAASYQDPRTFRDLVLEGLEEIREDLADNRVTDPQGTAARAAGLYLARIRRYFDGVRVDPTWTEILGRGNRDSAAGNGKRLARG